ncbi:neuroguidin isoform X2 [Mangifera indica]|uniref:neuroguidin isoform X2 n=1 Tax=Mangifera indica TaxID=29780 RepID=UPI001CFAB16C|nr:neuroguidin isoform X2 [Mangifera indica]
MEGSTDNNSGYDERVKKEAPQLAALLKEMKEGLDAVSSKVQALITKVKENNYPTADGLSYLEAKHLLLLNYCQSIVYYLLRKAKGLSIDGHPVVRSLVEIRLFLEKIRPIDKKLQYQIQKLTSTSISVSGLGKLDPSEKESDEPQKTEDLFRYRPNPDMLVSRTDMTVEDNEGMYKPPKFAPTSMDEDKMSRKERNALRKEEETLRQARQSTYMRELMDNLEGRPEEVRETFGSESRELTRYKEKMEERARQEEELFTRAPLTKMEKKKMKHLKKSRNGLLGLTDSFYDEIKTLPMEDNDEQPTSMNYGRGGMGKLKKRKIKQI